MDTLYHMGLSWVPARSRSLRIERDFLACFAGVIVSTVIIGAPLPDVTSHIIEA